MAKGNLKTGPHAPRNKAFSDGMMRFSSARMYQKKAVYKKKKAPVQEKKAEEKPVQRRPRNIPAEQRKRKKQLRPKKVFAKQARSLRPSITPGTVLILLTGRHKGKRVVFLKQLSSGLLLVTGPIKLNGCPLRRVNQRFVLATKTKLDISGLNLPERVNDEYFRRQKTEKKAKDSAADQLFHQEKESYELSEDRKADQKTVDKQLFEAIKKHADRRILVVYLSSLFSLSKRDYPHAMVF